MPCDQTGCRGDGHTGEEGGAEHQGGAELTRAMVHTHYPLNTMPNQRACRLARVARGIFWHQKRLRPSDQLLRTDRNRTCLPTGTVLAADQSAWSATENALRRRVRLE